MDLELVETVLKMPMIIEAYYSSSGDIDRYKKQCQDDL